MNKKRILFDLDGVLTDFVSVAPKTEDGKVDWDAIKLSSPGFWENLNWIPEGKILIEECIKMNIPVGILTAVFFQSGKVGKLNWLKNNLPMIDEKDIYIVSRGDQKCKVAGPNDILIDDIEKYVNKFNEVYPGHAILYTGFQTTMENILRVLSK